MESKIVQYRMNPNTIVTYVNDQKLDEVPFLLEVMHKSLKELRELRKYIVFGCLHCGALGTPSQPLQRCKGCDLVTFCNGSCRKKQWKDHKFICKQFPIINGKNLYTYGIGNKIEKYATESPINEKAHKAQQNDPYLSYLFKWKRACGVCEKVNENLTDCECSCVAYCSPTCKKVDCDHQKMCSSMQIIAQIYSYYRSYNVKNIPSILDGTVQKVYKHMKSLDRDLIHLPIQNALGKNDKWEEAITGIMSERLAYPMAILFVLQKLAHIPLKAEGLPFPKASCLTIHVAHRHPVLDSCVWEYFLHCLPELQQLNIVFISPAMFMEEQSASLCSNVDLKLERCQDCAERDRIITYSVISMHYHVYYSSSTYYDPDVIVIYDANKEIQCTLGGDETDTNCFLSIVNMTYDTDTLLVLVDSSKHFLKDTVDVVRHVTNPPLEVMLKPQPNKLAGFNSKRQIENVPESVHVACLQKKKRSPEE